MNPKEEYPEKISVNSRPLAVRKPDWLKVNYTVNENFKEIQAIVRQHNLHTVCEEAHCPNIGECWRRRAATLMILDAVCTRNCRFCAVSHGKPLPPDPDEPQKVGNAIKLMGLRYAVITSVTRDDLPNGGATHWAKTIQAIRDHNPDCKIEVLIPDFQGNFRSLDIILATKPDVLGHNLETVKSLYPKVRPQADYQLSLQVLQYAKEQGFITKTGVMVGLGETMEQVTELMQDARAIACDLFTAGQYLQPTRAHLPVQHYVTPEEFESIKKEGLKTGFRAVMAGPLVRSSYHAEEMMAN